MQGKDIGSVYRETVKKEIGKSLKKVYEEVILLKA